MSRPSTDRAPRPAERAATAATRPDFAARVARAGQAARSAGLTGMLVTPGPDLTYLAGYTPSVNERLTLLVVAADAEPVMVVPTLERGDAARAEGGGGITLVTWSDGDDPYGAAAATLDPNGRYAISDAAWALHVLELQRAAPGVGYVPATNALPMLRAVKDEIELARLAAAGAAADATYTDVVQLAFAGRREVDIAADLARLLVEHGHDRADFTIVGSGPNGANPHHGAGERVIRTGDVVVMDFGGTMAGYGSDTTRTVVVGEPPARVREVHEVVRRAQQAGFAAVRPGATCQDVDRAARAVIDDAGYGEHFIHRTGHGIGLTVHEPPYMVEGETQELVPGMCFSVEPGIYLPGAFGVRIEDIVTVTSDGGRRFNTTSRELQVVS
ncbi:MAG TPA: aminopeptidase P family protein [Euzebyales bacterium]|nr:aminopeptidase P family protein [Euzebyales bacterium]